MAGVLHGSRQKAGRQRDPRIQNAGLARAVERARATADFADGFTDDFARAVWVSNYTFAIPELKILYVATLKAACTSLMQMFTQLAGRAPMTETDASVVSDDMLVHVRDWNGIPHLFDIPSSVRADALHGDDGWLTFSVVRNPYQRCASAWANKVLLEDPHALDWDCLVADVERDDGSIDLRGSFEAFLARLESEWPRLRANGHFGPQVDTVRPDLVDYTLVARTDSLGALEAALARHLGPYGVSFAGIPRANESFGVGWDAVASESAASTIVRLYGDDFEAFGYPLEPPTVAAGPGSASLTPRETRLLREIRDRNHRIHQLSSLAKRRTGGRYGAHEFWRGAVRKLPKPLRSLDPGAPDGVTIDLVRDEIRYDGAGGTGFTKAG
jgi:hypothetical protein